MRIVHWISRSNDKKTGSVLVSYSPKSTCPDSCNLKDGGCYAWGLFYINNFVGKLANGTRKATSIVHAIKSISKDCKIARHRVAGDIVGDVEATIHECIFVEKNGLINIGYTHNWRDESAQPLKKWFRASCQSEAEVLLARSMGWSATLIVDPSSSKKRLLLNGEEAIMCPARHGIVGKKDITCNSCTLCKVTDKTYNKTVMFAAHGNAATLKKINGKI